MFQEIAPHTYTNDFAWLEPEPGDRVLVYAGTRVLVRLGAADDGTCAGDKVAYEIDYPRVADLFPEGIPEVSLEKGEPSSILGLQLPEGKQAIYLFSIDDDAFFFLDVSQERIAELLEEGCWSFFETDKLKNCTPMGLAFAGIVGLEYRSWYETRRFCGSCGARTVHDLVERAIRCPECGTSDYPKLYPAVIVAVVNPRNGKVLVSRYAGRDYTRYALIAGFAELGETIEQTVHREVMEEVGLRVKNLRYYKSQPWPFSSSLLMGFFCELDGSDEITLDTAELEYATWLEPEELPDDDVGYSLTRDMMRVLREGGDR